MLIETLEVSLKRRGSFGSESLQQSGLFQGRFNYLFASLNIVLLTSQMNIQSKPQSLSRVIY